MEPTRRLWVRDRGQNEKAKSVQSKTRSDVRGSGEDLPLRSRLCSRPSRCPGWRSVRERLLAPGDLVVFVGSLSATTVLISTHDPTTQPNGVVRMCAMDVDSLRALSPIEVLARCDRE